MKCNAPIRLTKTLLVICLVEEDLVVVDVDLVDDEVLVEVLFLLFLFKLIMEVEVEVEIEEVVEVTVAVVIVCMRVSRFV